MSRAAWYRGVVMPLYGIWIKITSLTWCKLELEPQRERVGSEYQNS